MRRTKIVCTLGPSTDKDGVMAKMMESGMNVARCNMSHGSYEEHAGRMNLVRKTRTDLKKHVGIMLDTKGPEIRLRTFEKGKVMLKDGDTFVLTTDQSVVGTEKIAALSYMNFPKQVKVGDSVLINDGKVELIAKKINGNEVECVVEHGGEVSTKKAINLPGVDLDMPFISEVDAKDIEFGISQNVDYMALSFVRTAQDVLDVRAILKKHKAEHIQLISKIENRQGVNNLAEIIQASDGVMVARGDMGVEIPYAEVPVIQKRMIKACNQAGKFVITATQMLESMTTNPRPTRAEVSDVANAVLDGTSATMLSGESAAGDFPYQTVQAMANIIAQVEKSVDHKEEFERKHLTSLSASLASSQAACISAMSLGAKAIIVPTTTGKTAREMARFRPSMPIIAICASEQVATQLSSYWGVLAVVGANQKTREDLKTNSLSLAKAQV